MKYAKLILILVKQLVNSNAYRSLQCEFDMFLPFMAKLCYAMNYEWEIKRESGLQPQPEPKAGFKSSVRGNA